MSNLISLPHYPSVAFRELMLDVKEVPGTEHNARILQYFRDTSLKPYAGDETSWCAAGINFVLMVDGILGTNAANARSFLGWGVECELRRGAIGVLWRESRNSWKGHVGIVLGWSARRFDLLGGNQGNTWSVKRFERERLLGTRWATEDMRYTG